MTSTLRTFATGSLLALSIALPLQTHARDNGVVTSAGTNTKYTSPSAIGDSAIGGRASTKLT